MALDERRKGRPKLEGSTELDRHLLETAARLFAEHGFDGTSMDRVAAEAGSGKQSLYRRYTNKAALFEALLSEVVIKRKLAMWRERLTELSATAPLRIADPLEELRRLTRMAMDFFCDPETRGELALLMSDGQRFEPMRAEITLLNRALENEITHRLIAAQDNRQLSRPLDPSSARHLIALTVAWPLFQTLFGQDTLDTVAKRDAYFDSSWAAFVEGKASRNA